MKKLGKKLNYFIKVFLVVGMLFTNLSSLTVVFAYEGEDTQDKQVEVLEQDALEEETKDSEEATIEDESKEETTTAKENTDEEKNVGENSEENTEGVVTDENKEDVTTGEEPTQEATEEENTTEELDNQEEVTEPTEEETALEYDYTKMLNDSAKGLGIIDYLFKDTEDGKVMYVIVGVNQDDIEEIIDNAFTDVTYELVEEKLILTRDEEEVTYEIVIYDRNYLLELTKLIVGDPDTLLEDGDINSDGNVNQDDVIYLDQILKYGFNDYELTNEEVTIDSRLDAYIDGEKVDNEVTVSTGDTFTVEYVLTLSKYAVTGVSGLINYNKDMFKLDVEVKDLQDGANYDGKFLYLGDPIMGTLIENEENDEVTYEEEDYVIVVMTFTVLEAGSDTITINDIGYYDGNVYYEGNTTNSIDVIVLSSNNNLETLTIAGEEIELTEGVYEYEITVKNDVTLASVVATLNDGNAEITSIVAPEELAEGENEIIVEVTAENGAVQTYIIKVTREASEEETTEEETVVSQVSYQENTRTNDDNVETKVTKPSNDDKKATSDDKKEEKDGSKLSRIIIIILILLAIAGLIYLIFKDEDDEETKKANKEIDKLRKEENFKNNKNDNKVDKKNKKGR